MNEEKDAFSELLDTRPFYKKVKYQRMGVLVILTFAFVGLLYSTQRNNFIELSSEENDEILVMEDQGFSYAFGTEPNDLGNEIENFIPASEEQINQLVNVVENDEELIAEEGQDLFELLEYDEWNNEGLIAEEVVTGLIQSSRLEQ